MRTYSVVCWTKRDRKLAFFHRKKKHQNKLPGHADGPRLLGKRWWVLYF